MNDALRVLRGHMAWAALGVVLASGTTVEAQPATVHRIGVLTAPIPSIETGLRDALRELGYVEARSLVIEWSRSAGAENELRALASDLARAGVELIVAPGNLPLKQRFGRQSCQSCFSLAMLWPPDWWQVSPIRAGVPQGYPVPRPN